MKVSVRRRGHPVLRGDFTGRRSWPGLRRSASNRETAIRVAIEAEDGNLQRAARWA
jgi:hypothetical protein